MTAKEKFEARLKELGLYGEWKGFGVVGKVMEDGTIVILVNFSEDADYREVHYPSFEDLWQNEDFRWKCKDEFYGDEDNGFVASLSRWLDLHRDCDECPLHADDVYFPADGLETQVITFRDDQPVFKPADVIYELAKMCGLNIIIE